MGTTELRLVLKAADEASKVVKGFGDETQRSLKAIGQKMTAVGGAMTAGVTTPIVAGFALATKAAIDEEKAMSNLATQVLKNTDATKKDVDALEGWITKTAYATGVADDDLRPALSRLVSTTKDVTKSHGLLKQAMDISAATGKPLEAVVGALQKGYLGNVGGLSKLGIATKDAEGKTLTFKEIMRKAVDTYGGAASQAAETTAGKMAVMRNKMNDVVETIGTQLIPIVTKVVDFVSKWIEKFNSLTPAQQKIIVIVGLVVAAIGPLLMVLGQIIAIAPAVGAAFTFMTGPVGLIIVAIAAVVAAFVLLWTKCDWFRNFWIGLWEKVKAAAQAFWDWAGPTITAAAEAIWSALQTAFDKVKAAVEFVWPYVKTIVETQIALIISAVKVIIAIVGWLKENVWDPVKAAVEWLWPYIAGFVAIQVDAIVTAVKVVIAIVKWLKENVWDPVQSAAEKVWKGITGLVGDQVALIIKAVDVVKDIVGIVGGAFSAAKDKVDEWSSKITGAAKSIWEGVHDTAETWWGKITGVVETAWNNIAGFVNKIINAINWVLDKVPGLGGVARIPLLPVTNGGGGKSIQAIADAAMGGGSPSPTVNTPAIMDNGGMGGPEAQGSDAGKGGSGAGGRGGLGGDTASWIVDLWDKFGIGAQLPAPTGGLFGGATGALLDMAKTAIVGLLKKFADRGDRNSIIEFAKSMLGVPYLWGGTSPAGFDCSGLIYWAYQQAGIKDMPRIPTYGGKQISYSDIQPADVLFYYPNAVQDGQTVPFGHFKMYAGGGQTIESTSGGVQMRPVQGDWAQIRSYLRLGGITHGLAIAGEGGPSHPEAVVPLTNPRRGAAVLAAAGLLPRSGDVVTINVDAHSSSDPAAVEAAARRGAIIGYAEAKRATRRGAGR